MIDLIINEICNLVQKEKERCAKSITSCIGFKIKIAMLEKGFFSCEINIEYFTAPYSRGIEGGYYSKDGIADSNITLEDAVQKAYKKLMSQFNIIS
ncbi:MAG: hypothetical protein AAB405_01560 [Patescibacteria group bacterium]